MVVMKQPADLFGMMRYANVSPNDTFRWWCLLLSHFDGILERKRWNAAFVPYSEGNATKPGQTMVFPSFLDVWGIKAVAVLFNIRFA